MHNYNFTKPYVWFLKKTEQSYDLFYLFKPNLKYLHEIIKQIMPEVIILGCIYALSLYRDLMRAEGLKHNPILLGWA